MSLRPQPFLHLPALRNVFENRDKIIFFGRSDGNVEIALQRRKKGFKRRRLSGLGHPGVDLQVRGLVQAVSPAGELPLYICCQQTGMFFKSRIGRHNTIVHRRAAIPIDQFMYDHALSHVFKQAPKARFAFPEGFFSQMTLADINGINPPDIKGLGEVNGFLKNLVLYSDFPLKIILSPLPAGLLNLLPVCRQEIPQT